MKRQGWLNRAYCDLHVAKLADSTEAASFLPKVADSLVAHGSLTVSEWAAVTLFSKKKKEKQAHFLCSHCKSASKQRMKVQSALEVSGLTLEQVE